VILGPHSFRVATAHVLLASLVDRRLGIPLDVVEAVTRALENLARSVSQTLGRMTHLATGFLTVRGSEEESDSGADDGTEDEGRYIRGALPAVIEIRIFLHDGPPWPAQGRYSGYSKAPLNP